MDIIKYLIIPILLSLNFNLVVGYTGLSEIYTKIKSYFSHESNICPYGGGEKITISSPICKLDVNITTSVCNTPPYSCQPSPYRSIDGSCNNLQYPGWGTPNSTYGRMFNNSYADGISELPKGSSGYKLPSSRELSNMFYPDKHISSPNLSLLAMQFGQLIAHDMSLALGNSQTGNTTIVCCKNGKLAPDATNKACAPIIVPINDPSHLPGTCLNFIRTQSSSDVDCAPSNKPAEQLTGVTAFMDVSYVYGSSDSQAHPIREFSNGRLKIDIRKGREFPPQVQNVTKSCTGAQSPKELCCLGGDVRINQNVQLTLLQVALVRHHNKIADRLHEISPHWDDEKLFQESRRVVIAEMVHITYYEWLPFLLGEENMIKNKLIYPCTDKEAYVNDYDPTVNPAVLNEHATGAFRYFHSDIRGDLERKCENGKTVGVLRLSDHFNRPQAAEDFYEELMLGLTLQPADATDLSFTKEITQYLFRGKNKFGRDLRAVDIQRARDHGLGTYADARVACNLPEVKTFEDLCGYISDENIAKLKKVYRTAKDIEYAVAASLEFHVPGARAGPTFLCVMTEQFLRTRVGDRYFYENGHDLKTALKPDQLASVRNSTMAGILCDSSDIKYIVPKAFELRGKENYPIPCKDVPKVNLNLWKETIEGSY